MKEVNNLEKAKKLIGVWQYNAEKFKIILRIDESFNCRLEDIYVYKGMLYNLKGEPKRTIVFKFLWLDKYLNVEFAFQDDDYECYEVRPINNEMVFLKLEGNSVDSDKTIYDMVWKPFISI